MTCQDIVNVTREKSASFNTAAYNGYLALQITLKDLNEQFYIEIMDGKLSIEPYEYNDRQANMIISSKDFIKLINGKLNPVTAYITGKLKIDGNIEKAKELSSLF